MAKQGSGKQQEALKPHLLWRQLDSALRRQKLRDLPWRSHQLARGRDILDPYAITVSEVMLQQTQVERVIPYYCKWLQRWPTWEALAKAPQSDVVRAWSGLGYNRRAIALATIARLVVQRGGTLPHQKEALLQLPGIGDYTAAAIRVFAFNLWDEALEANGRLVLLAYARAPLSCAVGEAMVKELLREAVRRAHKKGWAPREWYWRLMDHGAHLRSEGIRVGMLGMQRRRQGQFRGSLREVRGGIVCVLGKKGPLSQATLFQELVAQGVVRGDEAEAERFLPALEALKKEGFIAKRRGKWGLAS